MGSRRSGERGRPGHPEPRGARHRRPPVRAVPEEARRRRRRPIRVLRGRRVHGVARREADHRAMEASGCRARQAACRPGHSRRSPAEGMTDRSAGPHRHGRTGLGGKGSRSRPVGDSDIISGLAPAHPDSTRIDLPLHSIVAVAFAERRGDDLQSRSGRPADLRGEERFRRKSCRAAKRRCLTMRAQEGAG